MAAFTWNGWQVSPEYAVNPFNFAESAAVNALTRLQIQNKEITEKLYSGRRSMSFENTSLTPEIERINRQNEEMKKALAPTLRIQEQMEKALAPILKIQKESIKMAGLIKTLEVVPGYINRRNTVLDSVSEEFKQISPIIKSDKDLHPLKISKQKKTIKLEININSIIEKDDAVVFNGDKLIDKYDANGCTVYLCESQDGSCIKEYTLREYPKKIH